jgi:putative tryptophan/tyrosine transport system substrate-binding protein
MDMISVRIIAAIVLVVLVCGCTSQANQKIYHVGVLYIPGSFAEIENGFKDKMTESGYVEGRNIVYDIVEVPLPAKSEDSYAAVMKLVDKNVDLIFAFPTPMVVAVHNATNGTEIPVVFAMANPETLGLINSVRNPGGKMTGVRYPGPEMISKRMEILNGIDPNIKRFWLGYDRNHPNTNSTLEALRSSAASLGITLVEVPATTLEDLRTDLEKRESGNLGFDAMLTMNDGLNVGTEGFNMLNKFASDHKIPLVGGVLKTVQDGAVIGSSPNLTKMGDLAAMLADKILRGIPAGTIPVVTPSEELYINYKVARELGLDISDGVLGIADYIVR